MNKNLGRHTYEDFVGSHGGRRTAALAGRFRKAKGMQVTDKMQQAMMQEAMRRSEALARKPMAALDVDPGGVPDAPAAPRVGGRTSPGTTPAANPVKDRYLGPGDGSQMIHPWNPGNRQIGVSAKNLEKLLGGGAAAPVGPMKNATMLPAKKGAKRVYRQH